MTLNPLTADILALAITLPLAHYRKQWTEQRRHKTLGIALSSADLLRSGLFIMWAASLGGRWWIWYFAEALSILVTSSLMRHTFNGTQPKSWVMA